MPLQTAPGRLARRAAVVVAACTVVIAPLLLGTVHAHVLAGVAAAAHLAALLEIVGRWRSGRSVRISALALPFGIAWVLTALQLTPLPATLLGLVSPASETIDFVRNALPDGSRGLVRQVLSVDPPETALALVRLAAAACITIVVAAEVRRRRNARLVENILAGGALLLAIVTLAHVALGFDGPYGLMRGSNAAPVVSPLLNPNHLGRALGAGALIAGVSSLRGNDLKLRAGLAALSVVLLVLVLGTQSVGAVLALLVAAAVVLFAAYPPSALRLPDEPGLDGPTRDGRSVAKAAGPLVLIVIAIVAAGAILAATVPSMEQLEGSTHKLQLYPPAFELVREYWATGTGASAFMGAFHMGLGPGELWPNKTITHPENLVLQTLADYGLLGGSLVLGAGAYVCLVVVRSAWRAPPSIALGIVCFLVVGDLVDFSLSVGFGLLLLAAAAGLAAQSGKTRSFAVPPRVAAAGLACLFVTSATASWAAYTDSRLRVDRQIAAGASAEVRTRALARHPLDSQYAYGLAVAARDRRDAASALRWSNVAMVLWPAHPGAHVEAARVLAALGKTDQALLEYALALESGTKRLRVLVPEIVRNAPHFETLASRVNLSDPKLLATVCREYLGHRKLDEAQACADRLIDVASSDKERLLSIMIALQRRDGVGAEERLDALLKSRRRDGELASVAAQIRQARHSAADALAHTADWSADMQRPGPLLRWRVDTALEANDLATARLALEQLRRRGSLSKNDTWIIERDAELLQREGRLSNALQRWQQLVSRHPKKWRPLIRAGLLQSRLGLKDPARESYSRAEAAGAPKHQLATLRRAIDKQRTP